MGGSISIQFVEHTRIYGVTARFTVAVRQLIWAALNYVTPPVPYSPTSHTDFYWKSPHFLARADPQAVTLPHLIWTLAITRKQLKVCFFAVSTSAIISVALRYL